MRVAVIGSFVTDLMARTPHLPKPGETVRGTMFRMGAGGKGFNQAVAATKAGADLFFSTKVGKDLFSALLSENLKANGMVDNLIFETDEASTAVALIPVDEVTSQNEIVIVPGACATITPSEIDRMFERMEGVGYLMLQHENNADALEAIVDRAFSLGIKIILNPAPVQPVKDSVLSKLYAITPNEVEAASISGLPYSCDSDCASIAGFFKSKGVKNVVLTLGKRGVFYSTEDNDEGFIDNYPSIKVVDTTGAGDAFNGGLLAALGNGMSFVDACIFANVVSNLSVSRIGTSASMPSKEEIELFICQNGVF